MMKRTYIVPVSSILAHLVCCSFLLGCSAEDGLETTDNRSNSEEQSPSGLTAAEMQLIKELLTLRGFDTSTLKFEANGLVVVENDIEVDGHSLLQYANETMEKGYKATTGTIPRDVWIINSSTEPVSLAWALAFISAAIDWTNQTGLNVNFDGSAPPLQTITLRKAPISDPCVVARGTFPWGGFSRFVGQTITVNSNFNCVCPCCTNNIETLPAAEKIATAAHEFGHNFGMAHPGEGSHISGTAVASSNYTSVMWSQCVGGKMSQTLSSDDILSSGALWH